MKTRKLSWCAKYRDSQRQVTHLSRVLAAVLLQRGGVVVLDNKCWLRIPAKPDISVTDGEIKGFTRVELSKILPIEEKDLTPPW